MDTQEQGNGHPGQAGVADGVSQSEAAGQGRLPSVARVERPGQDKGREAHGNPGDDRRTVGAREEIPEPGRETSDTVARSGERNLTGDDAQGRVHHAECGVADAGQEAAEHASRISARRRRSSASRRR